MQGPYSPRPMDWDDWYHAHEDELDGLTNEEINDKYIEYVSGWGDHCADQQREG